MSNSIKEEINYKLKVNEKKDIELKIEEGKIHFLLNNIKFHEECAGDCAEKFKNGKFIKTHNMEYVLNGLKIQLIELYNGIIVQIGKIGISIYRNIAEFMELTKKTGKRMDVTFYSY